MALWQWCNSTSKKKRKKKWSKIRQMMSVFGGFHGVFWMTKPIGKTHRKDRSEKPEIYGVLGFPLCPECAQRLRFGNQRLGAYKDAMVAELVP
jgi:hypothetical protein